LLLQDDFKVEVRDFSCQPDSDGFVIGLAETGAFLAVPSEAVQILSLFRKGGTVGDVRRDYRARYSEEPDLGDFLNQLQGIGLVRVQIPLGLEGGSSDRQATLVQQTSPNLRFHFENVPQSLAKAIFSKTSLGLYAILALTALFLIVADPAIIPERAELVFKKNISLYFILFLIFQFVTVIIHEMGHLMAAKSRGVNARLGFGNRMWVIVAETDLTGIWSIPKNQRYLPLLGGPLMDVLILSMLGFVMTALHHGALTFPAQVTQFVRAMFLFLCFRLIWQMYFFVRTDFYYVFTTFFECKNLMMDTRDYIYNIAKRVLRVGRQVDQSAIGKRELWVIRCYSLVWLAGRLLAMFMLCFYLVPVLWHYLMNFIQTFGQGLSGGFYPVLDTLLVLFISGAIYGVGFYLWGKSILQEHRSTKEPVKRSET